MKHILIKLSALTLTSIFYGWAVGSVIPRSLLLTVLFQNLALIFLTLTVQSLSQQIYSELKVRMRWQKRLLSLYALNVSLIDLLKIDSWDYVEARVFDYGDAERANGSFERFL